MDHSLKQTPAILLEDLQVTLPSRAGPVAILRGIELEVATGDSIAVVGPSGSGKSTLLMVIAGLESATEGRVRVVGADYATLDEDGLARLRAANIGIVFQSFHLVPTMTAIENVALPLEFLDQEDAFNAARAALAEVGLSHREAHFPGQLSGGEQQRVAIARALSTRPALILADEPTGNLDLATGAVVMDLLFTLKERLRATLLLITHDRSLAKRCDRIVSLADGRIVSPAPSARSLHRDGRQWRGWRHYRASGDPLQAQACARHCPARAGSGAGGLTCSCCASRSASPPWRPSARSPPRSTRRSPGRGAR